MNESLVAAKVTYLRTHQSHWSCGYFWVDNLIRGWLDLVTPGS